MRQSSFDQHGREWQVLWGYTNEAEALEKLGITGQLKEAHEVAYLSDPAYGEEKSLTVYRVTAEDKIQLVAVGEISAGVYAVGLMK